MQSTSVPPALRDRLGHEAAVDLVDLLELTHSEAAERMLNLATERFERRLTQEVSTLRVEFNQGLAALRSEIATSRVELLKWSFLFWVGHVAAISGVLALMLHSMAR